jgi:hypothetical protein
MQKKYFTPSINNLIKLMSFLEKKPCRNTSAHKIPCTCGRVYIGQTGHYISVKGRKGKAAPVLN